MRRMRRTIPLALVNADTVPSNACYALSASAHKHYQYTYHYLVTIYFYTTQNGHLDFCFTT